MLVYQRVQLYLAAISGGVKKNKTKNHSTSMPGTWKQPGCKALGETVVAVQWGPWREVGMAATKGTASRNFGRGWGWGQNR